MGEFKTGKIVCMIEGAKIKQGENNPVYSIIFLKPVTVFLNHKRTCRTKLNSKIISHALMIK